MARKKTKSPSQPETETTSTKKSGLSKAEAIRRTLGALGNEAQPLDIQVHVRREFGIEMDRKSISTYKTAELKKAAERGQVLGQPKETRTAQNGLSIADVKTLKDLVGRVGAARVKELADVLSD